VGARPLRRFLLQQVFGHFAVSEEVFSKSVMRRDTVIFRQLIEYFKALQLRGALITVIGLLPFIFDDILNFYFGLSLDIPATWAWPSLFIAFGVANFLMFRGLVKIPPLEFKITEVISTWFNGVDLDTAMIDDTIVVGVHAIARVATPQGATSVRLFVESVKPSCLEKDISMNKIETEVKSATGDDLENPVRLQADEMKNVSLIVRIPFSTVCIEKLTGSLSKFKEMTVVIGAKRTGSKSVYQPVDIDLQEAHRAIEQKLAKSLRRLQSPSARCSPDRFLSILRRYWLGETCDNKS